MSSVPKRFLVSRLPRRTRTPRSAANIMMRSVSYVHWVFLRHLMSSVANFEGERPLQSNGCQFLMTSSPHPAFGKLTISQWVCSLTALPTRQPKNGSGCDETLWFMTHWHCLAWLVQPGSFLGASLGGGGFCLSFPFFYFAFFSPFCAVVQRLFKHHDSTAPLQWHDY